MKLYQYIISALAGVGLGLQGCSDAWDDHYDPSVASSQSLYELVKESPDLSDFLKVLQATHVYNNAKRTNVTYADLLNADQTLTVWAPQNGTFDVDALLAECQTEKGDSAVARRFVMNHITHNLYTINSSTQTSVLMLNDKELPLTPTGLKNAEMVANRYNVPATNGLLHVVGADVPYAYNIYEGITSIPQYAHLGNFLMKYEKLELDENRSIVSGIVDGEKVYSDSVLVRTNQLFYTFDHINREDSSFIMLVPDKDTWEAVYDEAQKYFDYGSLEKADSVQTYWASRMLMQDLFYNRNVQHLNDSAFSTSYVRYAKPARHVYYKPLADGGIFSGAYVRDSLEGSNGVFYNLSQWPFKPEDIYFLPIKTEAEREANILDRSDCTLEYRAAAADSISEGYLRINPKTSSSNWKCKFEVANTLAGTYDICAVILPKTVYNTASRDFKPNKFVATLTYTDHEGHVQTKKFDQAVSNNPYAVDTLKIGTFTFPVCNYQQTNVTVQLQLECQISRRETSYSRDMYLDCIYLKPTKEEE